MEDLQPVLRSQPVDFQSIVQVAFAWPWLEREVVPVLHVPFAFALREVAQPRARHLGMASQHRTIRRVDLRARAPA